ncbi:MAG: hypothetical protein M0Q42_08500 [Xanthomonadales bacterium]|nr:hypothetical protein [Xanthomonadales bacterium]
MINRTVSEIVRICQLKGAPQNLPVAPGLALALLALAQGLGLANAAQLGASGQNLMTALASLLFTVLATRLVLQFRGKPERFWQTLLALAGTAVVFALLAFPVAAMIGPLPAVDPAAPAPLPVAAPLLLVIMALACWRLVVSGHIWRNALEVPLPVGILIVLALFLTELVLLATFIAGGDATGAGTGPGP